MNKFSQKEFVAEPSANKAFGMLNSSKEWLDAAAHLVATSSDKFHPGMDFGFPLYFLIMHGLEASLKCFLHAKGLNENKLKGSFGHDIRKLLEEAERLEICRIVSISSEGKVAIYKICDEFRTRELQYFSGDRLMELPRPTDLLHVAWRIHGAIEQEFTCHLRLPTNS